MAVVARAPIIRVCCHSTSCDSLRNVLTVGFCLSRLVTVKPPVPLWRGFWVSVGCTVAIVGFTVAFVLTDVAQVEVYNNGVRSPTVPLLLLDDASVTNELQSAFSFINTSDATTESTAGNASTDSPADDVRSMVYNDAGDDLLLDLGAWATYAAAAASVTIDAPQLPVNLPQIAATDIRALAEHLLSHLQECGWTTTAKYIRSTWEAMRHDARIAAMGTATTAVKASGTIAAPATAADGDIIHRLIATLLPPSTSALLRKAFLQALGLDVLPPKEEEVYQAYATLRVLAHDYVMWV